MKPEKTTLVKLGYDKEKNRYFATFKVQDLDKKKIGRIISYCEMSKRQKDRKIYINNDDVYITDFIETNLLNHYTHL